MRTYEYFSAGFQANVRLTYTEGLLSVVDVETYTGNFNSGDKAHFYILEDNFLNNCKANKIRFTEIEREITFEMFWKRYKYTPDKQLAIQAWNKLTKAEQLKAYDWIPTYDAQLKNSGLARKYAVRYLKDKPWIQ